VVILTTLTFVTLPIAESSVQAYLFKPHTSGDQLDLAIRKAIATVGTTEKGTFNPHVIDEH